MATAKPKARQKAAAAPAGDAVSETAFLAAIGHEVRSHRAKRGMTRRQLAEASETSERYLAQIESGAGNPSASVLRAIARSLDLPIAGLLPETGTRTAPLGAIMDLLARVPEGELPAVRLNLETHRLEVDASIPNSPETPEHGVLAFIDNTVDRTTGTILLKGLFQNENRRLWPGEFVNASLTLNEIRDAVLVPSQAVQSGQDGSFVFVVDTQMRAHLRPIVAGAQIGGDTVIKQGIEAGETVVTDGQLLLAPGAQVKIRSAL